ncbi:hypothetical protein T492DRAFT_617630 [Pavlovales sp. CCMP2436]|nr:hypothetical protein T492DRAFT_617630 [Pavlovales sp. CCMP2436]|mmetsp:Transcript_12479/g.31601  ORF Transcript_12479/g.31601 Transcript_12479/m.31601 type:complete len:169 (+) Transcript_12479:100-606(+)
MGSAESAERKEEEEFVGDAPEAFGVRVSSRLLDSLQAADSNPNTVVTMSGAERRHLVEAAYQEGANVVHGKMVELFREAQEKQNQEQTELMDRLEHPALDEVESKVKKLHEREYRAPTRDVPCADERSDCLKCYAANGKTPLECADKVAAFDRCAQAVRDVHLQTAVQ